MPGVSRVNADLAGSTIIGNLAPTVHVNNNPIAVKGASVTGHGRSPHSSPVMIGASSTVFANGIPICRNGDAATCGHVASGSGNVFANGGSGGGGGGGARAGGSVPRTVRFSDPNFVANTQQLTASYVSNPGSYYNANAQADGVKANYSGTADDTSTDPGEVTAGGDFSDIIPFLQEKLNEASTGKWRESGQGGKPSNPKITGIWSSLGFPGATASPWNSDQTAWCMGFVNYALQATGYKWVPTASAAAITQTPGRWSATQVPKDQAQPGDIAFWSYRHVNFVYEKKGANFTFVGGNQTPAGGSNNPSDGDITISYPGGTPSTNANWVSCWRPSRS